MDACGDQGFIIRTFTATDACGLTATCIQTITVTNTPPILTRINLDITISCNASRDGNDLPQPTATDDCTDTHNIVLTYVDDDSRVGDCNSDGLILRRWTATDQCGAIASCLQVIFIENNDLSVNCNPFDERHECNGRAGNSFSALAWNDGNLTNLKNCSSSSCSGDITVTSNFDFNNLSDECGFTGNTTVEYIIADECGNNISKKATLTIEDTTNPGVSCEPDNRIFECIGQAANQADADAWNAANMAKLEACATDICSDTVSVIVTSDFDYNQINPSCSQTASLTVTYTITDECGNAITATATLIKEKSETGISDCSGIEIQSTDSQIIINGLFAPNTIAKVFDKNYHIVFECIGGCTETEIISNLNKGEIYHTDIQFYDENWQFICEDKQNVEVTGGNEPCDTSVCAGNVVLRTQAEVDAFCGCQVIHGNLSIGSSPFTGQTITDITNILNLSQLKKVKGGLHILNTQVSNLLPLHQLTEIGLAMVISHNPNLKNVAGLEQLIRVDGVFVMENNNALTDFNQLNKF